jgi:hypothetical protein
MKIQSTRQTGQPIKNSQSDQAPKAESTYELTIKDVVTKSAFTAGGALGGTGLGVATGLAISNISGNPVFGQFGGLVGAVGGAAAGLAASQKGASKANLARSVGAWAGASVLSSGGMWAVGHATSHLAAHGAGALIGANGALVGAVAGGLVGAAIPFIGSEGRLSGGLKDAACVAAGGTAGMLAGAGIQAAVHSATEQAVQVLPQLAKMMAPVPFITTAVGALSALDYKRNPGYSVDNPGLKKTRNVGWAIAGGYAGGALVGSLATLGFGGSSAYMLAAPAVAATTAGLTAMGAHENDFENSSYTKGAQTLLLTGLGAGVGDAVGAGLTALTGNSLYRDIGAAAGAANGLTAGLRWAGLDDKKGLPLATGLISGGASGVLLGAGISALSGQNIWNTVVPVLGAATGALTGLALAMKD